jgi:hypothetical protein
VIGRRASRVAACVVWGALACQLQRGTAAGPVAGEQTASVAVRHESRERPDLLDARSPAGLRLVQITTDATLPSWNVYTEAAVFTPDSRRFVFVRQTAAGPIDSAGRGRQFWVCDLQDDFALRPLIDEPGMIRGTSMSVDGTWFYYIVEDPESTGAALVLRRVSTTTYRPETVLEIRDVIPGTRWRPSRAYPLSTMSSDGRRLATGCFLGDGGTERIQGHQAWRGRLPSVLSAMNLPQGRKGIREGFPIAAAGHTHQGGLIPGGRSWAIEPDGGPLAPWHFGVDASGRHLVIDTKENDRTTGAFRSALFIGTLSDAAQPVLKVRYLLDTGTSGRDQPMHPHPFFSPDATMAFFNSDVDGQPQVWMVTGFTFPD